MVTVIGRSGANGISPAGRQLLSSSGAIPSQCMALSTMKGWKVCSPTLIGRSLGSIDAIANGSSNEPGSNCSGVMSVRRTSPGEKTCAFPSTTTLTATSFAAKSSTGLGATGT